MNRHVLSVNCSAVPTVRPFLPVGNTRAHKCHSRRAALAFERTEAFASPRVLQRRVVAKAVQEDVQVVEVEGKEIDTRVPVTVITGFLGSGKTTLLNSILTKDHGQRIAVIENEFGEIDIDSSLVAAEEDLNPAAETIVTLNNGCLCCTVRDDLVDVLNKLYERRDSFDRVLIETTGLADPAPIIQTFFLDDSVARKMKLDGVVTLVDAKHVGLRLDEKKPDGVTNEALQQISYADRIIINKTDLVSDEELSALESRIRSINTLAHLRRAQRSDVPVEYVMGVGGFDLEKVEEELMAERKETEHAHSHDHGHECGPGCDHPSHAHDHSHDTHAHAHEHGPDCGPDCGHEHHHHDHAHAHDHSHSRTSQTKHDDAVSSVSVQLDGELDLERVNYWLSAMIEVRSMDLFRMKGVLAIKDFDKRFVFQGVHELFEGMPDRPWKEGEPRVSRMVFIGRQLDRDTIQEGFEACIAKSK